MLIRIQDVHKTYRLGVQRVHALRGVSFVIEEGEYLAIMGASGSGKSTLMNILGCLDTPTSGSYRLKERAVDDLSDDELKPYFDRQFALTCFLTTMTIFIHL